MPVLLHEDVGLSQPWDYITEENAERCVKFLAEQVAYLANLGQQFHAQT